jgi:hypothetical protein
MAKLRIEGDELVVHLSGWERFGAFHGHVRVPLAQVTEVRSVEAATRELYGLRIPGTGLPGVIALGTWRRRGAKDFVAAYRRRPGVVIDLDGHDFARIVVSGVVPEEVLALG